MSRAKPVAFKPYFTEEQAGQIRAAFLAAGRTEGYATMSELIEHAILRELRRLQRKYNHGKEWPVVPPGVLRPGQRTLGEQKSSLDGV